MECLRKEKLSQISVTDISRASGISRATFYRIFDSPMDLLLYACDSMSMDLVESMQKAGLKTKRDFLVFVINHLMANSSILETIYENGRMDIFEQSLTPYAELVSRFYLKNIDEDSRVYINYMLKSMLAGAFCVWEAHGKEMSAEHVVDVLQCFTIRYNEDKENIRIL